MWEVHKTEVAVGVLGLGGSLALPGQGEHDEGGEMHFHVEFAVCEDVNVGVTGHSFSMGRKGASPFTY